MNCSKCGAPIMQGDQFCKGCGTPVTNVNPIQNNPANVIQNANPNPPINNVQQTSMQSPMGPQPMPNRNMNYGPIPNKGSNPAMVILGVIIVIAICVVGYFVVKNLLNNDKNENGNKNNNNQEKTVQTIDVKYEGFTLPVSVDYAYTIETDSLNISDEAETWAVSIVVEDASFTKVKTNLATIKQYFENNGATSTMPSTRTLGGVQFVTAEVAYQGQKMLVAYARATGTKVFQLIAINTANTIDYDLIEKLAQTISKAKYTSDSNNIEFKLNISDLGPQFQ